jgi:cytochrome c oxidase assembly protein subunit 15
MVIVATALVLYRRAGIVDQQHWHRAVDRSTMAHIWWIVALGSVALVTGTVVTGTGPHSGQNGSKPVRRFGFAISSVARVHSIAVLATLGTVLWLVWRLRGHPDRLRLENPLSALLLAGLVQGSVGYVQYFSGVPVGLVAIHIAGATLVWLAIVNLALATRTVVESAHRAESGADGMELAHGFVDDLSHRTN